MYIGKRKYYCESPVGDSDYLIASGKCEKMQLWAIGCEAVNACGQTLADHKAKESFSTHGIAGRCYSLPP